MTIQQNVDLLPYNTFRIQAFAKYFTTIKSIDDAKALFASDIFKREKHFILGGGSNVLLTKNFDGLVVKVEILGKEKALDDADGGMMMTEHVAQRLGDIQQAARSLPSGRGFDRALNQNFRVRLCKADDSIAGPAQ